jgi:hypothetical protein
MMFSNKKKIAIDKGLYERLAGIADVGGYSSLDEFIVHILEREAAKFEEAQDEEQVEKQLRGLGYIE